MKVIIAGSRTITRELIIVDAVHASKFEIIEVVSGGARGVDKLGERYAESLNLPLKRLPANWNKYGLKAGYLRNVEMANYADALIAVWDGKSRGTKMMIDIAKKKGLKVFVYEVKQ